MSADELKKSIMEILEEIDPLTEVDEQTDLLEELLDSMSILFLISELARRTDVEIPMYEVTIDNFSKVGNIVDLAERYVR